MYWIIPIVMIVWTGIAYCWWRAMDAEYLEDMAQFAIPAAFASFLFTGPFCMVIWYTMILRMIWISRNIKPSARLEPSENLDTFDYNAYADELAKRLKKYK